MNTKKINQKGFFHWEILVGLLVIVAVAAIGLKLYNRSHALVGVCSGYTVVTTADLKNAAGVAGPGQVTLYKYGTGPSKYCAVLNHTGSAQGVAIMTSVALTNASNVTVKDAGLFKYYAGPVTVAVTNGCTRLAASIVWNGATYTYDNTGWCVGTVTPPPTTDNGWVWPVRKEDLTYPAAGLGQCWLHYYSAKGSYHSAIDISVRYKPVYAPHDGKVVGKYSDGYNTLIINTGLNAATNKTLYAVFEHMSSITVSNGATVTKGQRIGTSGEVGAPGVPHLHFGISDSSSSFGTYANPWHTANPLDFLPADYSNALEKTSAMSCKTSSIKGRSDFGFAKYRTNGTFNMYY
jgi:murein DD-endopeptidase MepM/ murein hydrolase activator NlpD